MKLIIDTTDNEFVVLTLVKNKAIVGQTKTAARRAQGEKLLPALARLLKKHNLKLSDLTGLEVANGAGSFSSLRIGITTANALGYALGIPVKDLSGNKPLIKKGIHVIKPKYFT